MYSLTAVHLVWYPSCRMYPSGNILRNLPDDITICGYQIPAKVLVACSESVQTSQTQLCISTLFDSEVTLLCSPPSFRPLFLSHSSPWAVCMKTLPMPMSLTQADGARKGGYTDHLPTCHLALGLEPAMVRHMFHTLLRSLLSTSL